MPQSTTNIASIGLKARTGRAIAVVLGGSLDAPELIKRAELILTDPRMPATFQPYHEVMELPWNESQVKVKPYIRAIEKVATKALEDLIHELRSQGLTVAGVGIVGSADRDFSKIGNFHIRAHAAEGILFRQVLEHAATKNKLPQRTFVEKTLLTEAAKMFGWTTARLNNWLKNIGRTAGPPWRAEQRLAATAAWLAKLTPAE
jgi:hypothetical protein